MSLCIHGKFVTAEPAALSQFYENWSAQCENHAMMSVPELQPVKREAFRGNSCRGQEDMMQGWCS